MNKIAKAIKPYLKPVNIAIAFVVISVIVIFVVVIIENLSPKSSGKITESQIMIQRGEKVVIVNESGLVEYRTKDGVFYETWDSLRIQSFFDNMRAKAREYLSNPIPELCDGGYTVTLYLNGREVTICVAGDDEDLNEIFEEFPDEDDGSLDDIFDDFFGDNNGDSRGSPTPTPTITLTPTPTPTPTGGSGGHEEVESGLFECNLYEQQVTGRTIISNTLCILEEILE